jgi:excisionase family DNA binding protein
VSAPATADAPLLLTDKQVGELLGCSPRHVRRLVDNGQFPKPIKLGHLTRWPRSLVEDFVREARSPRSEEARP